VHTHDLLIDKSDEWDVVEAIAESLKKRNFISPLDFVEKSVNSSNGLRLVVASQNYNLVWEPHFQCEEKADDFAALFSSIDVISHKEES
jgi:hypothetical protein